MPGSCLSWVFVFPVGSQVVVVVAVVQMAVDIEESYCCAGKVAVDVAGGQLDWEDIGFVLEGIHNLLQKQIVKIFKLSCTTRKSAFCQVDPISVACLQLGHWSQMPMLLSHISEPVASSKTFTDRKLHV